jgi:hypothetical protein
VMVRRRRRNPQVPEMDRVDGSTQRDPRIRSLYVVARPIRKAGRLKLSFLSEGSFPFCHWGLFVSYYNENELLEKMIQYSEDISDVGEPGMGTMFELQQTPQGNKPNVVSDFRLSCWEQAVYAQVGETRLSDQDISDHGTDLNFKS